MTSEIESVSTPMRFVICDMGTEIGLCCPVCGLQYVHPDRVAVEQGRTRTEVTRESTLVTAINRESFRGSLIRLRFHCESGHGFEYQLQFCKGNVVCELSTWEIGGKEPPAELWRN